MHFAPTTDVARSALHRYPGAVPALNQSSRAILWMIASCVAFASMWVLIRWASVSVHPFEIVFFRNLIGLAVLVPMLVRTPGLLKTSRLPVHARRATSGLLATLGTFYAVANAPLATALAINYTAPLFATVGAVMLLGEKLHTRRIATLLIGFAAMLIVIRPGHLPMTFGIAAALLSAVATGFSIVAIRQLTGTDDSRAVAAWSFVLMLVPSLVIALFVWTWPPMTVWPLLFAIGGVAAIGQLTMAKAYSLAEATAIMPYDFVRFAIVTLAGVTLFGERWDWITVAGGVVIVLSTIYLAYREGRVAHSARAEGTAAEAS